MNIKTSQKIIKNKLALLKLADMLGSVSKACEAMDYSRESYYRFKQLYEQGGEAALQEINRQKPCLKNRVLPHVEQAAINFAFEQPTYGQLKVSNELKKLGILVSPMGVRLIWLRHGLETIQKRLKAVKSAQRNTALRDEK